MKNGHVFNLKLSVLPTFDILNDMDINVKNRDFPRNFGKYDPIES